MVLTPCHLNCLRFFLSFSVFLGNYLLAVQALRWIPPTLDTQVYVFYYGEQQSGGQNLGASPYLQAAAACQVDFSSVGNLLDVDSPGAISAAAYLCGANAPGQSQSDSYDYRCWVAGNPTATTLGTLCPYVQISRSDVFLQYTQCTEPLPFACTAGKPSAPLLAGSSGPSSVALRAVAPGTNLSETPRQRVVNTVSRTGPPGSFVITDEYGRSYSWVPVATTYELASELCREAYGMELAQYVDAIQLFGRETLQSLNSTDTAPAAWVARNSGDCSVVSFNNSKGAAALSVAPASCDSHHHFICADAHVILANTTLNNTVLGMIPAVGPATAALVARGLSTTAPAPAFLTLPGFSSSPTATFDLNSLNVVTDCGTLQLYQSYLCAGAWTPGMQVNASRIFIQNWESAAVTASNVTLQCGSSVPTPCLITPASTLADLRGMLTPSAYMHVILLTANMTFDDSWPSFNQTPSITLHPVVLQGAPPDGPRSPRITLDLQRRANLFRVLSTGYITFRDLDLVNLPPGPYTPLSTSPQLLLYQQLWFVSVDQAPGELVPRVHLQNVRMVVAQDYYAYWSMWQARLSSASPSVQNSAQWLTAVASWEDVRNSVEGGAGWKGSGDPYLSLDVVEGGVVMSGSSERALLRNVTMVACEGDECELSGILSATNGGSLPLTQVFLVDSCSALLQAVHDMDIQGVSAYSLMLLNNLTMADADCVWPSSGIALSHVSVLITRYGDHDIALDFNGIETFFKLSWSASLTFENLILIAPSSIPYATLPTSLSSLADFASGLWVLSYDRSLAAVTLTNVTILVAQQELDCLLNVARDYSQYLVSTQTSNSPHLPDGGTTEGVNTNSNSRQWQFFSPFGYRGYDVVITVVEPLRRPGQAGPLSSGSFSNVSCNTLKRVQSARSYIVITMAELSTSGATARAAASGEGDSDSCNTPNAWQIVLITLASIMALCFLMCLAYFGVRYLRCSRAGDPPPATPALKVDMSATEAPPPPAPRSTANGPITNPLDTQLQIALLTMSNHSTAPPAAAPLNPAHRALSTRDPSSMMRQLTNPLSTKPSMGGTVTDVLGTLDLNFSGTPQPTPPTEVQMKVSALSGHINDPQLMLYELLGKGASGEVYRGCWRNLTVAVKLMAIPEGDANKRQSAAQEVAVLVNVQHPNVITTYSYDMQEVMRSQEESSNGGVDDNVPSPCHWQLFIVQEYCDLGPLRTFVDNGAFFQPSGSKVDIVKVVQVALEIAMGMQHVHSKNIVHGDLNPNNILMQTNNSSEYKHTAKVADFGLSVTMSVSQTHVSNMCRGTMFYAPPEVVLDGHMTKQADSYSFGIILWELYHGTPPWRQGVVKPVYNSSSLLQFSPSCPKLYRALCRQCMSRNVWDRPSFADCVGSLTLLQQQVLQGDTSVSEPVTLQAPGGALGAGGSAPNAAVMTAPAQLDRIDSVSQAGDASPVFRKDTSNRTNWYLMDDEEDMPSDYHFLE